MHGLSPGVKCVAPLFRHVLSQIMKCTHLRRQESDFYKRLLSVLKSKDPNFPTVILSGISDDCFEN